MAIYKENCFTQPFEELCLEERIFYRLISGFHSSTNAHIAENFIQNGRKIPNQQFFKWRLGMFPERIENVYFSFSFLYRAVCKAKPILLSSKYETGDPEVDTLTIKLLESLFQGPLDCSQFTEPTTARLFDDEETRHLVPQLRTKFQNISRLIDCVSCESCKVHSKLQIHGIGTALKIVLFEKPITQLMLDRGEKVALIQTLFKLAESIQIPHHFLQRERQSALLNWTLTFSGFLFLLFILIRKAFPPRNRFIKKTRSKTTTVGPATINNGKKSR